MPAKNEIQWVISRRFSEIWPACTGMRRRERLFGEFRDSARVQSGTAPKNRFWCDRILTFAEFHALGLSRAQKLNKCRNNTLKRHHGKAKREVWTHLLWLNAARTVIRFQASFFPDATNLKPGPRAGSFLWDVKITLPNLNVIKVIF